MNRSLNILLRNTVNALMPHRRGRFVAVAVLAVAALGATVWQSEPAPGAGGGAGSEASMQVDGFVLQGRVIRVADGDTFTLRVGAAQQRIRMASIDAPELRKDARRPGQPYGRASRDALAGLVAGKTLTLHCYEKDRYDRNICDVALPDGSTANQKQVAWGMAWANMEGKGKFMRDPTLPSLEAQARHDRRGLWRDGDPVRPWVWRYQCWEQQKC